MRLVNENRYFKKSEIYNSFLKSHENIVKNLVVYLDVVFPLVFSYEKNDDIFLSYVITFDEYEKELNVITTHIPNYSVLEGLINSKTSLFEIFDREYGNNFLFHAIEKDHIHKIELRLDSSCDIIPTLKEYHNDNYLVEDLLPEDDFYLTRQTINKLNLNEIKNYIMILKEKELNEKLDYQTKTTNFRLNKKNIRQDNRIENNEMFSVKYERNIQNKYIDFVNDSYKKTSRFSGDYFNKIFNIKEGKL